MNQITELDISKNIALEVLHCSLNLLTALDVSKNTELERLICAGNQLELLDVSHNTKLKELYCWSNQLTSLDVSNNKDLEWLECEYNQLTTLDIRNNTQLFTLDCRFNELSELLIGKKPNLKILDCIDNQLTVLDASECSNLIYLDCKSNKLTKIKATILGKKISATSHGPGHFDFYYSGMSNYFSDFYVEAIESPSNAVFKNWTKAGRQISTTLRYDLQSDTEYDLVANFGDNIIVSFDSQGGNQIPSIEVDAIGSLIQEPPAPARIGYIFDGWYTEADCINGWDFDADVVNDGLILFAKWTPIPVTGVELNKDKLTLTVDDYETLIATVRPWNAPDQEVTWSSDDETVATVDSNGTVNALNAGIAVITVLTKDGGFTASCTITVNPHPPIVTSVTVSPDAIEVKKGGTYQFSASVNGTNNPSQTVTWQVIGGATGTKIIDGLLTVAAGETATTLTVRATSTADTTKCGSATVTVTPEKGTQEAPSAPTLSTKTSTQVVLNTIDNAEYSKDNGATWQDSPVFDGLTPATIYNFVTRLKETDTHFASSISQLLTVTTEKGTQGDPSAPTLRTITHNSVTLTTISGAEYRRGNGAWQTSPVFTGLSANTSYTFTIRMAETATLSASSLSPLLSVATKKASRSTPSAPKLSKKTHNSVVLSTVSGAEYRCGNGKWQSSPIFNGLKPNKKYTFQVRIKATSTHNVSPASGTLTVTTNKQQLSTPSNLKLSKKKATWKNVANNNGYVLKIMQGKTTVKTYNIGKNREFFNIPTNVLKKNKKYTFTLMAKGSGNYTNSKIAKSSTVNIK